jgi:diadenosine tetraphosphatase ApaH/serine/threonine PP2A family protein phosphatase
VTFELADGRVDTIGLADTSPSVLNLKAGSKYLLNPGSVGQPRDGDPRAAYALVDTAAKRIELFRVDYPIETTQAKVLRAGLPDVLAQRLAVGR